METQADTTLRDYTALLNKAKRNLGDAPLVRLVDTMIQDAIHLNSSDIHFEPYEHLYRIRIRVDGVLNVLTYIPLEIAASLTSRVKIMSGLDIAERRVPQDGRFKMTLTDKSAIDFRVSTCPTLFGEKVVMRILDPSSAQIGIDALGYTPKQKEQVLKALAQSQGMIIVTGPTGSGKTVSLYTGLNLLNTEDKNISTVEDPVEINLPGINQVNINTKAGLDFASALRSFLRQDPDIIMVGEIRDLETAEIAVKAAQTGHLVLSTLHTNSAPETIMRLVNMGVATYNIASSILLIIAQRLVRRLCPHCKTPETLPEATLKEQGFHHIESNTLTLFKAVGCEHCTLGYKGRIGLFEVLPISTAMQTLIMNGGNAIEIATLAAKEGINTLRQDALCKVAEGITSLDEINRVTSQKNEL